MARTGILLAVLAAAGAAVGCSVGTTTPVRLQDVQREDAAQTLPALGQERVYPKPGEGATVPVALRGPSMPGGPSARLGVWTDDDPLTLNKAKMNLLQAEDFMLTLADGSGWGGFDVVTLDAAGRVTFTFGVQPAAAGKPWIWKRAQFELSPEALHGLRQMLENDHVLWLKRRYSLGVADGLQQYVTIHANGQTKVIYCDNYFPAQVCELMEKIKTEVLATHAAEIGRAPVVEMSDETLKKLYDFQ